MLSFAKKNPENSFNIAKNQKFELITSHHFKNLISKTCMEKSLGFNSFEKFKATASLPILFAYISVFFLIFLRKTSKPGHRNLFAEVI